MRSDCGGFQLQVVLLLACCFLPASTGLQSYSADRSRYQCGHPEYKRVCFEHSVRAKLVFNEFEPVVIRCVVRNLGKHVVTWMKNDGRDIPLTIGHKVFASDSRVKIDYSSPDEWNLVIQGAQAKDSGEYLCQVNTLEKLLEKRFQLVVRGGDTDGGSGKKSSVNVKKQSSESSKRLPNDEAVLSAETTRELKNVLIYGPAIVLQGEQFVSFTCTATFRGRDARRNPDASVEWYHLGLRQVSNASSMDISMSWKDGDTIVSVLTIYSVRFEHSGDWVCLKQPSEKRPPALETASHQLTVLEWDPRRSSKSEQLLSHQQQRQKQLQKQQQQQQQQQGYRNRASAIKDNRFKFALAAAAAAVAAAQMLA
ncbi:hypothetical protein BOX15_Mlig019336g3 [Macrostomum lignano]|uniref:Ig-like domain-containing protein n=1 Tax=Macrostomum lignano TaxID=282301 RepID=A0A267EE26_9PLAT|nr:hypothetical protein BOX15_Mlig019336g3 [Macrostomum lignano]